MITDDISTVLLLLLLLFITLCRVFTIMYQAQTIFPQYTVCLQMNGAVSKVNKKLFLSLHGQNVHCQQRQLSKFRMRYQQLAFHAYCRAAGSVYKMAPQQEEGFLCAPF